MTVHVSVDELLEYTRWERGEWRAWMAREGPAVLAVRTGPHGDGRFATVGEVVRHVFSAELRYVDRIVGREPTDASAVPADDVESLFRFGERSRAALRELLESHPADGWDTVRDFTVGKYSLRATPRKLVVHSLLHEIRHWAQIATLLRLQGHRVEFHDFLFSPVMGGAYSGG